jgi:hypothetical protein
MDQKPQTAEKCLNCGCPQSQWPNPEGSGSGYCCDGCAAGGECTCGAATDVDPAATGGEEDERSGSERMDSDRG